MTIVMRLKSLVLVACFSLVAPSMGYASDDAAATPYSSFGDAKKGKKVFRQCMACHNVAAKGPNRAGPTLHGLFGRKAGGDSAYSRYSDAFKAADFIWTEERIFDFIADPNAYVPGLQATMRVRKVRTEQERNDVIAFLRQATAP